MKVGFKWVFAATGGAPLNRLLPTTRLPPISPGNRPPQLLDEQWYFPHCSDGKYLFVNLGLMKQWEGVVKCVVN